MRNLLSMLVISKASDYDVLKQLYWGLNSKQIKQFICPQNVLEVKLKMNKGIMNISNYEFKARVNDLQAYESKLLQLNPVYHGTDHQIDTYFNAAKGRLKLREGNIENALIHYERENTADAKLSNVILYKHQPDKALKDILTTQLGIKTIVDKKRKIYFIDNVKFHFDNVEKPGTFIEVEAISINNQFSLATLKEQCEYYLQFFGLNKSNLIDKSYSDLIEANKAH